ncbi:hypothetical protein EYF80_026719 [Liparis tanakae]|uniref:Uncharacterized protein n=1 Tax=Liparis tanakae TaxID=230148 RepID=A0A4Z2HDK2_9TELE|nr:hypothetical protein EYF80_026719 [Liparis tanakae]
MDGPTGGRNGSVREGGSCESLIPRFHQRVQIWRHLLFSRPAADQGGNWRGEGEGEKKKKKKTRPMGEVSFTSLRLTVTEPKTFMLDRQLVAVFSETSECGRTEMYDEEREDSECNRKTP